MSMQPGQDWNPVVLRKKAATTAQATSSKAVNAAIRSGGQVDTIKKMTGGQNRSSHSAPVSNAAKIDNETENFNIEHVSVELKRQIQKARMAKGMTQAQLAQAINEKPQVINEYESGKAIPNGAILNKLSRALGVTLRKHSAKK